MGKGSTPRPYSVDRDQFTSNWERTFGKSDRCDDYCCNHGCNQGRNCVARDDAALTVQTQAMHLAHWLAIVAVALIGMWVLLSA